MQDKGWTFNNLSSNMSNCLPFENVVPDVCGANSNWYGWGCGNSVGTLSTILKGSGIVTLHYGNCWNDGKVNVYRNNTKMTTALPRTTKFYSFDYNNGDELAIREEGGNGIIQLINISFTCKGIYAPNFICIICYYNM